MAKFKLENIAPGFSLYLGDCRDVLPHVAAADATVTDPPYGIDAARHRGSQRHGWVDHKQGDQLWDLERADAATMKQVLKAAKHSVIWGGNYYTDVLAPNDKWLVWDKGQTNFSLADVELAWCSWHGAARRLLHPRGRALQEEKKEHPTQKPLTVMLWCLDQLPKDVQIILDPFMGTGSTGVACALRKKHFIGIERDRAYYDIARRRIRQMLANTGHPPKGYVKEGFFY